METLSHQSERDQNLEIEKGKGEMSDLIKAVRDTQEYREEIEKRKESVFQKSGERITDEEIQEVIEGIDDPLKTETGVEEFKKAFWGYVEGHIQKHHKLPLYYDEKKYPFSVHERYSAYKVKADEIKRQEKRFIADKTLHEKDTEKSRIHDEIAASLVKEGIVPSHLWGRLVARLWLVGDGLDDINSARQMDTLRRLRRLEDGGTDTRFVGIDKLK